jgi:hypothetical protein
VEQRLRSAGLAGGSGRCFEAVEAARAQKKIAAQGAKSGGGSSAKTAGSARDQNPFAGKRECHESPLVQTESPHNRENNLSLVS